MVMGSRQRQRAEAFEEMLRQAGGEDAVRRHREERQREQDEITAQLQSAYGVSTLAELSVAPTSTPTPTVATVDLEPLNKPTPKPITTQDEKVQENRVRRMAERQGLKLVKSRRRDPRALGFGKYMLVDAHTNAVVAGEIDSSKALDLDQVETYLTSD